MDARSKPKESIVMKINYATLTVGISAIGAFLIVASSMHLQAAQEKAASTAVTQKTGNRAIPIKDVAEFDQVFSAKLNQAISESSTAAKGTTIFKTKIFRNFISECLYKCSAATLASREELANLRKAIEGELKQARSRKASVGDLAKGEITNTFFVGTVHKVSATTKSE